MVVERVVRVMEVGEGEEGGGAGRGGGGDVGAAAGDGSTGDDCMEGVNWMSSGVALTCEAFASCALGAVQAVGLVDREA